MRHSSGAGSPGAEEFVERVKREVGSLGTSDVLTIIDFGPDQATVREMRLDPAGTPCVVPDYRPWPTLMRDDELSARELAALLRRADPQRLILALSGPADGAGLAFARSALKQAAGKHPKAPFFDLGEPVAGLLRRAVSALPLSQWYELAAVRETVGGRLIPTTQPLFPPGARSGDQRSFGFRVEPSARPGTVLAVLAREDEADPPEYRVAQPLRSAPLQPGWHEVTATLLGRGRVRFEGLPEPLAGERRSWAEVRAGVPPRVSRLAPAHLIIALELCEPKGLYEKRIDCMVRLIEKVSDGAGSRVRYSLVGYGSHAFARMTQESPVEEACWADSDLAALGALQRLAGRGPLTSGSGLGAKLECALDLIDERLAADGGAGGRPVLVAIGTRPPFPSGYRGPGDALPCPDRADWSLALRSMVRRHPGMTSGAVYGGGDPPPEAWLQLGRHARGVPSGFDAQRFAASLGLIGPVPEAFPLPLIEEGLY